MIASNWTGRMMKLTGGCHCGAVRYELEGPPNDVALCHCTDCRRHSGAPVMAWSGYGEDKLVITKGEPKIWRMTDVSYRSFCAACGTGLFYRNSDMLPGAVEVQSATLDNPEAAVPTLQIQTAERLSWMKTLHDIPAIDRFPD
jgi:hypothetical protein